MKFYKVIASLAILNVLLSCGAGTLGGFEPITFPTSKAKLEQAVDSLFANYPQYRIVLTPYKLDRISVLVM